MTLSPGQLPSWALDTPGLDRSDAEELARLVRDRGFSAFATAVDPAYFLTLHLDRDTVTALLQAIAPRGDPERQVEAAILEGLSGILAEWLGQAIGEAHS